MFEITARTVGKCANKEEVIGFNKCVGMCASQTVPEIGMNIYLIYKDLNKNKKILNLKK